MKRMILACAALWIVMGLAARAEVRDTSFRDANGHRVQQLEITLDAPVAKVWAAFTTDRGFRSWAAPVARVTLGNDGLIEASYRLDARIGDPENIRNRIVAYIPERLLVLRNEHAPKGGPFKQDVIDRIRTIIEFQDLGGGRTRVVESGVGYGEGPDFDSMYEHFRSGNAQEFEMLARSLTTGPIDWSREAAAAQKSVQNRNRAHAGQNR